eukprot:TRINITY_DN625_c0_g1_i8.p2 TRINITY_DN625_c0_g1~~TRINITY_DN625_c0_g1_i8.p2  ORF type:complete len:254 (+),score=49.34 TRINITY_DN625_c0_g1_i8:397-1158(+)
MVCRPLSLSCLNVKCKADSLCIDDKVNGPRCVPVADLLKEGEVCSHNGDVKGDCAKGLECRPRDGVQTLVAEYAQKVSSAGPVMSVQTLVTESICQKPAIGPTVGTSICQKPAVTVPSASTCATIRCIATTTCVEDKVNGARCVPIEPATLLKEGEVCSFNGDMKGECVKGLECRPRDDVQTLVAESICQKPAVVDPAVRTCATMLCIATTTCVEDKVNELVPLSAPVQGQSAFRSSLPPCCRRAKCAATMVT